MRKTGKLLALFFMSLLVVLPAVAWWQAQAISDWWALRGYSPPARVAALAVDTTMTDYGRHIFYVNRPELISDVNQFHKECPQSEQTIVLGCFHSSQRGIEIYDVKDPRLSGIHEVTAAHEMLHAAYERLKGEEKSSLNKELLEYLEQGLSDERIRETLKTYVGLSQSEMLNEMHSIFGTEAATLPAELESHYKKYFSNRAAVTSLAENYDNEFAGRLKAIEDYDARIESLKTSIDGQSAALESKRQQIIAERQRLDGLRAAGDINQYNSGVAEFNSRVDSYNSGVSRLRRDINSYNALVQERNALASELRSLESSIDTRSIPEPVR